ncbi:hypothetical protein [Bradyrhizobium cenepequi]
MAVKPRINESQQEKANERLDRQVGRAYMVWLVGLFVGALHLKPEKVEYGGISFTIDSSEKLQGIIYVVCLVFYIGMLGLVIVYGLQHETSNWALKRRIVYGALGKKRTIIGLDQRGRAVLRGSAKFLYTIAVLCLAVITFFPAIHIIFFQQRILLNGIDAIFQTTSLKNGNIDPAAPATLLLTLILMCGWTLFIYRALRRLLGPDTGVVFISVTAAVSFASLDSLLRTGEPYMTALLRAVGLQTMVFIIWQLPKIIASPFMGWLSLQTAYYKWRVRRAERKKRRP